MSNYGKVLYSKSEPKKSSRLCTCAAHIGTGGVKIKKEPRQRDEYVYGIS